uniref:Uncharacterized protein n=2 Tax=Picea TaxID=3328 RepID=A0A101LX55_PICGL|nr:hypothetical protein ABT39_MTgene5998 [Picea glauca]QHR91455.1 hypothetical protein Q903MT_gene5489 [Picea sitchensis]
MPSIPLAPDTSLIPGYFFDYKIPLSSCPRYPLPRILILSSDTHFPDTSLFFMPRIPLILTYLHTPIR